MRNRKRIIAFLITLLTLIFAAACIGTKNSNNTNTASEGNPGSTGESKESDLMNDWEVYSTKFDTIDDWLLLSGISVEGRQYDPELTEDGLKINLSNNFGWFRAHQQFLTDDSQIDIEVTQNKGSTPSLELYCRSNEPGEYRFFIYYGGFWDIGSFDYYTSEYISLAAGMADSVNPDGEKNIFSASCVGDLLTLSINGKIVGEVQDSTYSSGIVGFGVQNVDSVNTILVIESFQVLSTNLDK
ncbi:MAG: hypothetical protein HON98_12340 [Chloroflexi bacterium]|jgi:hypothetical protein|nr:hypothetical protein [Chloroflexota bacterium]MBT3669253.1 hypothetical protein [Chloroflexota bacterium]MBT4003078.1 hypothetical protein [Chloroflexota bacterium]MBT4305960.1 hypothetical protein [Chloroflexota bacterium]MBT4532604.1 hypothetical protein [Chloroflexota bacterium]